MTNFSSLSDRYLDLIDQIVQSTLKGMIRSKEQVYQMLIEGVKGGTGEVFERCLSDRLTATQHQIDTQTDELKQAKAGRRLRALQTIHGEWERWQAQNQVTEALTTAALQIATAAEHDRSAQNNPLQILLRVTDPNQPQPIGLAQLKELSKRLRSLSRADDITTPSLDQAGTELRQLADGILRGLDSWRDLEPHLVSWIYDQNRGQLGFERPEQRGPWTLWAKQVKNPISRSLFETLAVGESSLDWAIQQQHLNRGDLVELVEVLRCLQQGLVNWFDKLVYDSKVGAKLSISTFLAFSIIWSQLASGFSQARSLPERESFVNACFQMTLQILRTFAQRNYFPLYGGIFASFSGEYLRGALSYLDEPLQQAEGTQEKARVLTLLGYSARVLGQADRAHEFHQQALSIAREAGDIPCEIANLNHLSRTCVAQSNYAEAINYSQRALILSRQAGDRPGEANALTNLGYSEVFQAQQLEQGEPEVYEMAVDRLQQGLILSERLDDRQSQALCLSSLGIAQVMMEQFEPAIAYLEGGVQAAQFSGDLYLQGINLVYLAEAHYHLQNLARTIQTGCLGMYLLEQIGSTSWRQPAGLLTVLRGQLGETEFQQILTQQRSGIIAVIGVDGYDHLPQLLEQYQAGQ
jgi:tetratricopeptide (TPR) repeat protein